jgi:hypothetical protein
MQVELLLPSAGFGVVRFYRYFHMHSSDKYRYFHMRACALLQTLWLFGCWTAALTHFVFDVVWMSLPLFTSSAASVIDRG